MFYPWMQQIIDILPEDIDDYNKDGSFFEIVNGAYALSIQEFGENDFIIAGWKNGEEIEFNDNLGSYPFWRVLEIVKLYFPKE